MSRSRKRHPRPQMTRYPSIEGPAPDHLGKPCLAFHKHDGSNLQFKWTQKDGWCQFGTRKREIDEANPLFGSAVTEFQSKYADKLLSTFRKHKEYRNAKTFVAFCEFFGEHTFSGLHRDREEKQLKLFDILLPENGFVLPHNFRCHFGHLDIAEIVYEGDLTEEFLSDVYLGKFDVGEGVVAKGVTKTQRRKGKSEHSVWMVKVKTQRWLEELARRAGDQPNLKQELEDNLKQQSRWGEVDNATEQ